MAPAVFLTLDLLLLSPPYTISVIPALVLSNVVAFAYWFWIEQCYSRNGFYPYPLFAVLNTPWRAVLFVGSAATMALSTFCLKWVYERVNGAPGRRKGENAEPGDLKRD